MQEGLGATGGQYTAASLCHSFLLTFFLCSSMGSPLEPARTSCVQPGASPGLSSQRSPLRSPLLSTPGYCHLIHRHRRCIWVCPLGGLWLLHHTAEHFSCACLWVSQDRQFPVHGIAAWEKGSSSTLSMVKSHHTGDWCLFFCCCLLLWIIL